MKQKTKITISALVVMLLMALAVTVISFSFADDSDGGTTADPSVAANTAVLTNIDYIVKNSNDTSLTENNQKYRIVEIGSSDKSTIADYVSNKGFENYVINGNKTIDDAFKSGNVKYNFFKASSLSATSATSGEIDADGNAVLDFAIISQADMIYISNGASAPYKTGNDISEDLYSLIQPMVIGSYIPVIVDMPNKSGSATPGNPISTTVTMGNAVGDSLEREGIYYYSFGYDNSWTKEQYFDTTLTSISLYLSINARTQAKADKYSVVAGDGAPKIGKMLVISKAGNALDNTSSMTSKLMSDCTKVTDLKYADDAATPVEGTVYDIAGSTLATNGYNSRYATYNPKYIKVDDMSVSDLNAATDRNFDQYDMVFIEADVKSETISDDLYNEIVAAMYGNVHFTYAKGAANASSTSGSSSGGTNTEATGTNYEKFYNMVSSNDVAMYQNVMLTDKSKIDIITNSTSSATAKSIADLINNSAYRGIGGPSSTSSQFSVLEIQPCYPIDEEIAAAHDGYYTDPDGVINGMTKEEIEGSGITSDYEYYAWELSKAKIADALDMNVANINLTQMSSEEFESSKVEVLGSYDLVYIGGNTSALKDLDKYFGPCKAYMSNDTNHFVTNLVDTENQRYLPFYTMYSHNGDFVYYNVKQLGTGGYTQGVGSVEVGKEVNGVTPTDAFTQLNGNDITSDNLSTLKDYVNAGMPIIFSDRVSAAYSYIAKNTGDARYLQNTIDPDSNMCKLLDYCNTITPVSADGSYVSDNNIIWGFKAVGDDVTEVTDSDNGALSIYSNQVRVFNTDAKTKINGLYARANKRPKLVLTSKPVSYNKFDVSTVITQSDLTFKLDTAAVGTTNYDLKLYIDDDGNSKFSSGELAVLESNTGKLTAGLADDFFGPLYWKLELVDKINQKNPTVSVTGLSYIRPKSAPKQDVALLQILPGHRVLCGLDSSEGGDAGGANGLYFCIDCQQAYKNLYYNPVNGTDYGTEKYYYGSSHFSDKNVEKNGTCSGIKVGLHEWNFGIVSYDSERTIGTIKGCDDWNHNLADDLKDYYNFDAEIMYVDDFQRYAREIVAAYDGKTDDEKKTLASGLAEKASNMKALYNTKSEQVDAVEEQLDAFLTYIMNNAGTYASLTKVEDTAKFKEAVQGIITNKRYSEYFALGKNTGTIDDWSAGTVAGAVTNGDVDGTYLSLYNNWVNLHDQMLLLKGGYYVNSYTYPYYSTMSEFADVYKADKANIDTYNQTYDDAGTTASIRIMGYKDYEKFAEADNWLKQCYTTVCVGPSEQFGGDDIDDASALKAISDFLDNDGQLLLFHDTLSAYSDAGSVQLTELLRDRAGANKNRAVVDTTASVEKESALTGNVGVTVTYSTDAGYIVATQGGNASLGDNTPKTMTVTATGNPYYSSCSATVGSTAYNNSTITIPPDASSSTETMAVTVTCTYLKKVGDNYASNASPYANGDIKVTVGNTTVTGKTDANGVATVNFPVKTKYNEYPKYTPYKTSDAEAYPSSVYFMTNLSYKSDATKYASWKTDFANLLNGGSTWMSEKENRPFTYVAPQFTDSVISSLGAGYTTYDSDMYKYAELAWNQAAHWGTSAAFLQSDGKFGTNRATKNNDAIVMLYPFQLADKIYIGGTHPQAFALDVDYDNLTVLYSLAAGTTNHERTSIFAADPGDGVDNYFMYACDNIYYCGAGHGKITGMTKDNQNERYLYLNVICNSVRNSAFAPTIGVYDPTSTDDKTTNEIVTKETDGSYLYKIDENVEYPEFSFKPNVDKKLTIKSVEVYYDLDYFDVITDAVDAAGNVIKNADGSTKKVTTLKSDGFNEKTDVLIAKFGPIEAGKLQYILDQLSALNKDKTLDHMSTYMDGDTTLSTLKLKDSYFAPYGGKFTYIVIKVTDSNGGVRYQRIKIMYKDKLFNLT